MLNDVRSLYDVNSLANVHKLYDVLPLNDVQGLHDVAPISLVNRYTRPGVFNTRVKKADSLLDVILAKGQRDALLDESNTFYWAKDIPIINTLAGAAYHEYDAFVKPILDNGITNTQGYKEVGLNTLIEISEDLDIFSNIIKSQSPLAGGEFGSPQTLLDALGYYGERGTYNYNTGNFFSDVLLETVSDPLTLVELGLSATKSIGKEGAEAIAKQAAKESSEEITDQTAKVIAKNITQYGDNIPYNTILKNVNKNVTQEVSEAAIKRAAQASLDALKTNGYKWFVNAATLKAGVDVFDSALTKAIWYATPAGVTKDVLSYGIKKLGKAIYNFVANNLKNAGTETLFLKDAKYKDAISDRVYKNEALNETIFKNNRQYFTMTGIDSTTFQKDFEEYLNAFNVNLNKVDYNPYTSKLKMNKNSIEYKFMQYELNKYFPKSKNILNVKELREKFEQRFWFLIEGFQGETFKQFTVAPTNIYKLTKDLTEANTIATIHSLENFMKVNSKNLVATYDFIDKRLLNGYGLENFEKYLKDLLSTKMLSKEDYIKLNRLFESLGLSADNLPQIKNILNSDLTDAEKNKALLEIIQRTNKEANVLTDSYYEKLSKDMKNRITKNSKKQINKLYETNLTEPQYASFKNVEQAVAALENNEEIDHALTYLEYALKEQDFIELETFEKDSERFKQLLLKKKTELKGQLTKLYQEQNQTDLLAADVIAKNNDSIKSIKQSIESIDEKLYYMDKTNEFLQLTDSLFKDLKTNPIEASNKIIEWYQQLGDYKKLLDSFRVATIASGDAEAVIPRKHLNKLLDSIDVLLSDEFVDPACLYISNVENMTHKQLSQLGMFTQINQHLYLDTDATTHELLSQLSNKNSEIRKELIPQFIEILQEARLYTQADNVYKVIAQIDTTTHLNELLSTKLPTTFKISNDTNEELVHIVFDEIINHSNYSVADMRIAQQIHDLSDLRQKELFDKIKIGTVKYDDYLNPTYNTPYDIVLEKINSRIDNTALINSGFSETQINELKQQCKNLLDVYLEKQKDINYVSNISLASLYSKDTIDALNITNEIRYIIAGKAGKSLNLTIGKLNLLETFQQAFKNFAETIQLGIDDIQKINRKIEEPISKEMLSEQMRQMSEQFNLYSSSIASGVYSTNDYLKKSAWHYKLNKDTFDCNNVELQMLSNKINTYANILHEEYKYDPKYIANVKQALTATYSYPHTLYAPVKPAEYFASLNEQQTLTWEMITKSNLSLRNRTNYYNAWDVINKQNHLKIINDSITDQLSFVESLLKDSPIVDDNTFGTIGTIVSDIDAIRYANEPINIHLGKTLHSLDDLDKHRTAIVKLLEGDINTSQDVINDIADIESIDQIANAYNFRGELDKTLKINNAEDFDRLTKKTYGYEITKQNSQKAMYIERKTGMANSIIDWSAEEIAAHIQQQTPGGLVFYNNNIIQTLNPDGTVTWSGFDNPFNFTTKELEDAGLKIKKVTDENGDWYLFALSDKKKLKIKPHYLEPDYNYYEIQRRYNAIFEKHGIYLNPYDPTNVPISYITAETLNKEAWENFIEANKDFFGAELIQNSYQKYKYIGSNNFFNKSYNRLNLSIVGGYDAYHLWNKMYSPDYIPNSFLMSRNTLSGMLSSINRSNRINKYLTMFFNSDYMLLNPLLEKMFSESSDKAIKDFFNKRDYRVVVLKQDRAGLPLVKEYIVNNRHSLERAKFLGAVMVPKETYWSMVKVVNNRQMTNNLLDIYKRVVPSTFKSMYLFTAGFPFRNGLDSLLFKNMNELGGLEALPDVIKYERAAQQGMKIHNEIQNEILTYTNGDTFNKEAIQYILSQHSLKEREIYYLTDMFIQSGASGGLSDSLSHWLEVYNKTNTEDIRMLWERIYEDDFLFAKLKRQPWDPPTIRAHPLNPLAHMRELNNNIEQTARFGLFLASVDGGMPIPDAIDRVIKTHFNYDSGEPLIELCERIFWFSTFPINNFNYYVNDGLTKAPNLIRFAMDTQTASWNNGEYTYEELKKTNFLSYHALVGNIRIGNWIVKTSPSLFDFLNLVTDLPGNLRSRLNPVYSVALGMEEDPVSELNPFITQWRNYQKMKEGIPVPSILSRIEANDWTRALGKWRSPYRKTSSWNKYPRIRKVPRYTNAVRKYYVRRYKTNVRNYSRVSLYKEAVRWYRVGKTRYFDV